MESIYRILETAIFIVSLQCLEA